MGNYVSIQTGWTLPLIALSLENGYCFALVSLTALCFRSNLSENSFLGSFFIPLQIVFSHCFHLLFSPSSSHNHRNNLMFIRLVFSHQYHRNNLMFIRLVFSHQYHRTLITIPPINIYSHTDTCVYTERVQKFTNTSLIHGYMLSG